MKEIYILYCLFLLQTSLLSQINDPPMTPQKQKFLDRWGSDYGYDGIIDDLREKQFKRMNKVSYLDYTASGQYQDKQLKENFELLEKTLLNNPHSRSPSSLQTDKMILKVRKMIIEFFGSNLGTYSVVFTSGATGALKLVAESFPFQENSEFWYTYDNHNSVLGIREIAYQQNVIYKSMTEFDIEKIFNDAIQGKSIIKENSINLVAYPAESNFAGKKWPLGWINKFHNKLLWPRNSTFYVILDTAAYVPTNPLNLTEYPADFVPISFYKMFGWPTGLGALIVRNDVLRQLVPHKLYFGGGTVTVATSTERFHQKSSCLYSCLEDGTIPFLSILAIESGLKTLKELGMKKIQKHTYALGRYLYEGLAEIKHSNGKSVVEIYGDHSLGKIEKQGPIVTFNIKDPQGIYFGYYELQTMFSDANIHVRTGCFCNPGACYNDIGIPEKRIIEVAMDRTSCGDEIDMIDEKPSGAVRSSIGYPTTFEDVDALVQYMKKTFVDKRSPKQKKIDQEEIKQDL